MTKFEELCVAANESTVAYFQLKERCNQFGADLARGLMAYLNCPDERATHCLLKEGESPKPVNILQEAVHVIDGWNHLGIQVNLRHGPPGVVGIVIWFNLVYKPHKDGFLVRYGRDPKELSIHPGNAQESEAFYDHIFGSIKRSLEENRDWYRDPQHTRGTFGFSMQK